jgi:quercetin dioxygenase-like cupin family protein
MFIMFREMALPNPILRSSAGWAVSVNRIQRDAGSPEYLTIVLQARSELFWEAACEGEENALDSLEVRLSEAKKSTFTRWADVEIEEMNSLIGRQFIVGTDVMVARVLLKKGAHVPLHSHLNEQVTYILEGALKFALEGKEVVVHAGEVLCIPPHVPHEAFALEDTVDLDVFNPPRQDWIDRDDAYLRSETAAKQG